jgi:hypothetical protein
MNMPHLYSYSYVHNSSIVKPQVVRFCATPHGGGTLPTLLLALLFTLVERVVHILIKLVDIVFGASFFVFNTTEFVADPCIILR